MDLFFKCMKCGSNVPDPTKNIRKGIWIGIGVGLVLSSLANNWLIISANPEAGQKLAEEYVWALPVVGAIGLLISFIIKIKNKPPTTMRGFFTGFSAITTVINFLVEKIVPLFITMPNNPPI